MELDILAMTFDQFAEEIRRCYGKGTFHAAAAYRQIFRQGRLELEGLPEFAASPALAQALQKDSPLNLPEVVAHQQEGAVIKFVSRLGDGLEAESVIVPMANHTSLCISCQVGCRQGCRFCQTGQNGLLRNLSAAEIVGQVLVARVHFGRKIRNIIFMGMGEPLDNFAAVTQSIRVMADQRGLDIAHRHITVSTAGLVDGIRQLAALNWPQLKLAVSLNAPNDALRSRLMPINRRFPMDALREALCGYPLGKKGALFMEYVLIKNVNDAREHARQLAAYLKPLPARLNLIACNPCCESPFAAPDAGDIDRFKDWLVEERVFVRKRTARGQSIMAACGQLGDGQALRMGGREARSMASGVVNGRGSLPDPISSSGTVRPPV
jgi:23S rRNA (adenine2503-C2)-methyltransferase